MNILIYSPVHLDSETFRVASATWRRQEVWGNTVALCMHDDGADEGTAEAIREIENVHVFQLDENKEVVSYRDQWTHRWSAQRVDRLIRMKNEALSYFLEEGYDFLLMVDSDLCIHPQLLEHLVSLDLDVVCEVFWTRFRPLEPYLPNVWDSHEHAYSAPESILRLRKPGIFKVGGMGACTLIKRTVALSGVTFSRIHGVPYWSEDPHFCIRLACQGYAIHVDTSYPAFHVYRRSMLSEARMWIENGCNPEYFLTDWLNGDWEKEVESYLSELMGNRGMLKQLARRWNHLRIAVKRQILIEGLRFKLRRLLRLPSSIC